jgi:hypothetical protein
VVGAVADASSGVATFPVTVTFDAAPDKFFVGATVAGQIVTSATGDVIQVPARAVTTATDGSTTVALSTDGTADHTKTQAVTTGITSGGLIEIKSGLSVGDQVVIIRRTFPGAGAGGGTGGGGSTRTGAGTGTGTNGRTGQ